jgi:uncharacterized membrane protein
MSVDKKQPLRTTKDRLRHTLLFEVGGLVTAIPMAAWVLDREFMEIGVLGVGLSIWAMAWNYVYNLLFDLTLIRLGRSPRERPPRLRLLHALLFEGGFLVLSLPAVAWWLEMSLWHAFLLDLGFAVFFTLYAYGYNWLYDKVFPYPTAPPSPPPSVD